MRTGSRAEILAAALAALTLAALVPATAAQVLHGPPSGAATARGLPWPDLAPGAWRQFRDGPAHTGAAEHETQIGPAQAAGLVVLWQAQAGSAALGDGVFAPPSVADGVVYVNSLHGTLNAFDAQTGALRWSVVTGGYGDSAPALYGGHVLVGAVSGLQAWPVDCEGACVPDWIAGETTVNPSLTVADGRVFAGEYSGDLRAYDLASGELLWSAKVNSQDPVFGSPTVADGLDDRPGGRSQDRPAEAVVVLVAASVAGVRAPLAMARMS